MATVKILAFTLSAIESHWWVLSKWDIILWLKTESFQLLCWEYNVTVVVQIRANSLEQSDSRGHNEMQILKTDIFRRLNLQNVLINGLDKTVKERKQWGMEGFWSKLSERWNYHLLRWGRLNDEQVWGVIWLLNMLSLIYL